ncbi:hypothetical protein SAMN04488700_0068 [Carnobacterium iners]|uniref:1,4-dihydroxy-2-naphthoate octaprenyltransferase n=1 Tax=Carnobacterium iners TaxID=1073423 RepID=A0A1X7MPU9_9LACT|nr:hypothetical protein [Carnobacterium iners]SEL31717.1 hypothetical protein SAMN04488114_1517 [Carnobacterium iners]SMH26361.1 hypothetical protein SAMN04488700_0068 [Carnobacterium iners]
MHQSLPTKIKAFFFHPLFLIFISPLAYILIGTIYAAQLSTVNSLLVIGLYLFILMNQFLEKIIATEFQKENKKIKASLLIIEAINLLIISSLTLSSHLLIGLLLVFYSILIQGQIYFKENDLKWLLISMKAIFKGGILTYISFFIQLFFIPNTIFLWSVPSILLALIIELTDHTIKAKQPESLKKNRLLALSLLIFLYISSIFILSLSFSYFSLLLLISLPTAWNLLSLYRASARTKSFSIKLKQLNLFAIIFLFLFALVISTKTFLQ